MGTARRPWQEFEDLLDEIDDRLPFRLPSELSEPNTAAHLHRVSKGLIGYVMQYVRDAAYRAIGDGSDRVELRHLQAAAESRRLPDDPYVPFASAIDPGDPLGHLRAAERTATESALFAVPPTLDKRRRGRAR